MLALRFDIEYQKRLGSCHWYPRLSGDWPWSSKHDSQSRVSLVWVELLALPTQTTPNSNSFQHIQKVDMSSRPGSQRLNSNQIILCLKISSRFCAHTDIWPLLNWLRLGCILHHSVTGGRAYTGVCKLYWTSQVCHLNWRTWHCLFSNVGIVTSSNNAKQMPRFPARKMACKDWYLC